MAHTSNDVLFMSDWLQISGPKDARAFCKYCKLFITNSMNHLRRHQASATHKIKEQKFRKISDWMQISDSSDDGAFCKYCRLFVVNKIPQLTRHQRSNNHRLNEYRFKQNSEIAQKQNEGNIYLSTFYIFLSLCT